MREDLLHFVWKYKKLPINELRASNNDDISILDSGTHNVLAGPDFFNAKIRINDQLWAGNVEIHVKSSDWYRHHHEKDPNYNNVILHVVWEDDVPVLRNDGSIIPTLELKEYIATTLLSSYQELFNKKEIAFINCEKDIKETDNFTFKNWLERLYFERLEQKSELVFNLLHASQNDWEKVLFILLLKSFGLNTNGDSFFSIAQAMNFKVVRKLQHEVFKMESLFFGTAGFLEDNSIQDTYYLNLQKEYGFLKNKFGLEPKGIQKSYFSKLRPANFPTIRLSQFANLVATRPNFFSSIISAKSISELYSIFKIGTSSYWETHFTFGKESKKSKKGLSKKFVDILIINTIIPLKFCYAKHLGLDINEELIGLISSLKLEENAIVRNYELLGLELHNAKDSQALLTLHKEYCRLNKCLQCAIGREILTGKD